MCGNLTEQLLKDVSNFVAFSLQMDKSTDIRDTAQLLGLIRMVFENCRVKEEELRMIYLKGRTAVQEIFNLLHCPESIPRNTTTSALSHTTLIYIYV
jgi:hypothetical protein